MVGRIFCFCLYSFTFIQNLNGYSYRRLLRSFLPQPYYLLPFLRLRSFPLCAIFDACGGLIILFPVFTKARNRLLAFIKVIFQSDRRGSKSKQFPLFQL
jgi:hypothetical protein